MRISDWSSDVCSSDLRVVENGPYASLEPTEGSDAALAKALLGAHDHMQCWPKANIPARFHYGANRRVPPWLCLAETGWLIQPTAPPAPKSEEHTSELQSLMRISYAVFCLKKKTNNTKQHVKKPEKITTDINKLQHRTRQNSH